MECPLGKGVPSLRTVAKYHGSEEELDSPFYLQATLLIALLGVLNVILAYDDIGI